MSTFMSPSYKRTLRQLKPYPSHDQATGHFTTRLLLLTDELQTCTHEVVVILFQD